jgi:SAM-dependent methyltransferase
MAPAVCVLCGADNSDVLFFGHDRQYGLPGQFAVHRCCRCGAFYLSPRPDQRTLGQYYPENYAPYTPIDRHSASTLKRWGFNYGVLKQVRAVLSRVPGPGRALDVGCATGAFLAALRRWGWRVQGVEINPQVAAYARKQAGFEVFVGDLVEAAYPADTFDLVTFWDVLEHLPNPHQALQEAARITRPAGSLVLSLPSPESLEARLFGKYWAGWDVPRHLWLCPRLALTRLLQDNGWEVRKLMYLRGRQWLLALSLRFWLEEQGLPDLLRRGILKIVGSLPAQVLLWPYFIVLERVGLGSIMVVFARKRGG